MSAAQFTVALDGDRPTEIELRVIVSPAKNSRGKPRANVAFECGKAKRRERRTVEKQTALTGRVRPRKDA